MSRKNKKVDYSRVAKVDRKKGIEDSANLELTDSERLGFFGFESEKEEALWLEKI